MAEVGKVLMVPGKAFIPTNTGPSPHLRAAFSIASKEQMNDAIERFGKVLKKISKKNESKL